MDNHAKEAYYELYAPIVIGNFFGCFLLGVQAIIAGRYFDTQKNDRRNNKLVVIILMIAGTAQTVCSSVSITRVTVLHVGDMEYVNDLGHRPEDFLATLFGNICIIVTQTFMASKACTLGQAIQPTYGPKRHAVRTFFNVLMWVGILGSWGLGLATPAWLATFKHYTDFRGANYEGRGPFQVVEDAQIACFMAVSIILTVILTFDMLYAKSGFAASNAVVDSVVNITVKNGLIVTIFQMVQLILGESSSPTWSVLLFMFIGKIYTGTALCLLMKPKEIHQEWQRRQDAESGPHSFLTGEDMIVTLGDSTMLGRGTASGVSSRTTASGNPLSSGGTLVTTAGAAYSLPYSEKVAGLGEKEDGLMGFAAALHDLEEMDKEGDIGR